MDRTLLLLLLGLFLFVSPLTAVWAGPGMPWYAPYLLWGGFIAAIAIVQRKGPEDDI